MSKILNNEWIKSVLRDNSMNRDENTKANRVEYVMSGKHFRKELEFKIIAPNSKENGIFSHVCGMHWNIGPDNKFIICTEQTEHLKKSRTICPVCEAKRRLLRAGFKEDELTVPGKFGPVPVFDPVINSNIKVIMLDSDLQDWDKCHISILQQKGSFLTQWLVRKYVDEDTPDFLSWESSHPFKFSRPNVKDRWEREMKLKTFSLDPELIEKLKEENEKLTATEIWHKPSDEDLAKMQEIVDSMCDEYLAAKKAMSGAIKSVVSSDSRVGDYKYDTKEKYGYESSYSTNEDDLIDDDMPF